MTTRKGQFMSADRNLKNNSERAALLQTRAPASPAIKTAPKAGKPDLAVVAALTQGAPVAIYHADAAGKLTFANSLYRTMFQLTAEQRLDDWLHIVHPTDRQRMKDSWAAFCQSPQAAQFQWRCLTSNGQTRFMSETIVPISVEGMAGFVGTITDVTELKVAQAEVQELQRKLMDTGQFGGEALEAMRRNARVTAELREAIQRRELELHYQPKLEIDSNRIVGAEALIRWRHPIHGLLPPANFVPLAEETGLIDPIGEWVIREACRQARAWQDQGLISIRIAINISPFQFRQGNLLQIIGHSLGEHDLDPRYLEIELTESTVMSDVENSAVILERLSQMGVTVSVDDFGTGYSNLSYLRRFPVDKLKIDRTFIAEIINRPDDASIVRAIVSLAHSLRLKVIAEGVETVEQLDFLKSLRCDQYQGYLFSPPLPPLQFAELLGLSDTTAAFMDADAIRTHSKLAAYRRS